jgi:hypothetical protein
MAEKQDQEPSYQLVRELRKQQESPKKPGKLEPKKTQAQTTNNR